jgi:hypothetical protein
MSLGSNISAYYLNIMQVKEPTPWTYYFSVEYASIKCFCAFPSIQFEHIALFALQIR